MELGCHRIKMANEQMKVGNNWYEEVKNFKYLGSSTTNQNSIHKEIKFSFKAGN